MRAYLALLLVLALGGCQPVKSTPDFAGPNTVTVVTRDPVPEAAAVAHAKLSNLPARVVNAKRIEVAHRPGGTPYTPDQAEQAVRENGEFWGHLSDALGRPAEPAQLDATGGASVRDFLPIGLIAAWQFQRSPSEESLTRLVDAYEAAVLLSENGALVHAECGKEIAQGIEMAGELPSLRNPAQIERLKALVKRAPSAADVLDRERINRLTRFAEIYRAMAKPTQPPTDPELTAYYTEPKQAIMDARDAYWKAWVAYAREPKGGKPEVPPQLTGAYADSTESHEALERMIAEINRIREAGETLLKRLTGATP